MTPSRIHAYPLLIHAGKPRKFIRQLREELGLILGITIKIRSSKTEKPHENRIIFTFAKPHIFPEMV